MKLLNGLICLCLMTALACLGACSGSSNGNDAGDADGNDGDNGDPGQSQCGTQNCSSSERCINDTVCVPVGSQVAQACEEEHDNIFSPVGPANLSCHNVEPCSQDSDCGQDNSGAQLVCKGSFCGVAAPNGGGLPATVTFKGCVDAFGIGDTTHQMRVALYLGDQDPSGSSTWDMATTEDQANCEYWGAFEFSDVPTNVPLILKTYDEFDDFVVTYKYNLVLWSDLATDNGGWEFDTRTSKVDPRTGQTISLNPWRGYAISHSTYNVILMAVNINLPSDHGAIAGTIRDCDYKEMSNVRCGAMERPEELTFFTNAENPRPDKSRDSSNVNGIYAAISLKEGTHKLSCLAQDGQGNQVPLGEYEVRVFAEAITILSLDWYPGVD